LRIPPWLVETILWTVGVLVAGLVLFFFANLLWDVAQGRRAFRRNPAKAAGAATVETPLAPPPAQDLPQRSLAEADALAAEGRYSEAIHLLLLIAMDRLRRELGPRLAPAMTSREVLRLAPLPGAALEPLSRMVALSEVNHFGGRSADEPDYRACRDDFLRFSGLQSATA
jgi:hypothetical protein